MSGGIVRSYRRWDTLVGALADTWQSDPLPPFEFETVIVSSTGVGKMLSLALAHRIGSGICAGARFLTIGEFRRRVDPSGPLRRWGHRGLALAVAQILPDLLTDSEFALVSHHLGDPDDPDRPGRMMSCARRFATTVSHYLREQPEMIRSWSAGDPVDAFGDPLTDDLWQYRLWRELVSASDEADPLSRHQALTRDLCARRLPGRFQIIAPSKWNRLDAELVASLAEGSGLCCHVIGEPPASLMALGWATETVKDRPHQPRMNLHLSHGPHRQVEVLREVLCRLFAEDVTLEPRDVLVQCPDLPRYAPLISAAFSELPLPQQHPGRRLRVSVAQPGLRRRNEVVGALVQLLQLPERRARIDELIALCSLPPVAARFGLDRVEIERLTELLTSAGVRWGVDPAHRTRFGVVAAQNTWLAGLDRLLAGLAMSDELSWLGPVSPSNEVAASDADLLGKFAELVSRVRWFAHVSAAKQSLGEWTDLLRTALDRFTVPLDESRWMYEQIWGELADLDDQAEDVTALFSRADLAELLSGLLRPRSGRPNYADGALLVADLGDLVDVGFRVVCLLGTEETPHPRTGDRLPSPTDAEAERYRDQRWWRAASAASDQVVVIFQGHHERTNEALQTPVIVQRLMAQASSLDWPEPTKTTHPLHAHSLPNFVGDPPASFDAALLQARTNTPPPPRPVAAQPQLLPHLDLDDLVAFISHPAHHYLTRRLGLPPATEPPITGDLPIQPSGLDRWTIGDRILRLAKAGGDLSTVMQAEWRRGTVGPGELGRQVLESVADQVSAILTAAAEFSGATTDHLIDLHLSGTRLTGQVPIQASLVQDVTFSRTDDRVWLTCWWRLVAVRAAGLDVGGAVAVGSPDYSREIPALATSRLISPPTPEDARRLLEQLVRLYRDGWSQVPPLPRRAARDIAASIRHRRDRPTPEQLKAIVDRGWKFGTDQAWRRFYPNAADLVGVPGQTEPTRIGELVRWFYLPMVDATQVRPHV